MALSLGELTAYVRLDTAQFDTGLGRARVGLGAFIKKGAAIAAAGGLAIGGAMAASLVKAMDVEAANDKLAAQLGLSEKEAQKAGETAGRLYANAYGESLEQVNDAVAAVMSSIDLPEGQVEAMTANVLNLASAMEIDVTRAAQVAGQVISTGLAKDGQEAADLLTAGLQRVPAALREDLLDAVDEYGKDFAAAGFSGEQAMNLLVAASEKGMYGIDKTGDAIKEFGIRATDMTAASKVGYDALGLSQEDMSNKLLAGGETAQEAFQQIIGGLQGMDDPARRAEAAIALFGTPIEDLGVTEIPKFLDSLTSTQDAMGAVEGSARNLDSTLNDNAATSWLEVRRKVEGLVTELGTRLLPVASTVAAFLAENMGPALDRAGDIITTKVIPAVQGMAQWLERNKTPIGVIAAVIGAVFLPALVAMGVQATISAAKQAAAWLVVQASSLKAAAMVGVNMARMVAGWALLGTQSLLQAARVAAAWFIALGPIGWVIAAVIGIVALIIANWDTIVRVTKDLWSKVTKWFSDLWAKAKALFSAGVTYVRNLIVSWVAGLLTKYLELRNKVLGFVGGIRDGARAAFQRMKDWVVGIVQDFVTGVTTRAATLRDAVVGAFESLRDKGKTAFENLKAGVSESFAALRAAAAKPVNFLINTVYTGGIKKLAEKAASALGLKISMPEIPEIAERRRGGWTPKGTVLVGERGPELVNFGRPAMVYTAGQTKSLMAQAETGTDAPGIGGPSFLDGLKDTARTAAAVGKAQFGLAKSGDLAGAAKLGAGVMQVGAQSAADIVSAGVRNLLSGLSGGGFIGNIARGLGQKMITDLTSWAKGKDAAVSSDPGGPLPKIVGGWMRPGRGGRISSPFGMRLHPISGRMKLHNGIDVAGLAGSRVLAAQAGRVSFAGRQGSYGNVAFVNHANGYRTGYAHLARILVKAGQQVTRGQQIGVEGATGGVTGKHLHFNVQKPGGGWINPTRLGVFDQGGTLDPGAFAVNLGRKPETILPPAESQALKEIAAASKYGVHAGMPEYLVVKDSDDNLRAWMRVESRQVVRDNDRRDMTAAAYGGDF